MMERTSRSASRLFRCGDDVVDEPLAEGVELVGAVHRNSRDTAVGLI